MHRIDADAHVSNQFSDGDPGIGQPGTKVDAAWLNAVQEEVAGFIESRGISLNKADHTQLADAIASYFPAVSWTALTPSGDWTTLGGAAAAGYWRDAAGVVHLKGVLVAGASGAVLMAGTLPAGYQPATDRKFVAGNGANSYERIFVDSSGAIRSNANVAQYTQIHLDGVSFVAEK